MSIDSDLIRGHVDTIILKTLADGDKYGYEIIKEIETKSNGTYELKQPTLYSCLKRLEGQGFISAYWVNSEIGGRRHYYKLTEQGRKEYTDNMNEWLSSRGIIDNLISNEIPAYEDKDYNLVAPKRVSTNTETTNSEIEIKNENDNATPLSNSVNQVQTEKLIDSYIDSVEPENKKESENANVNSNNQPTDNLEGIKVGNTTNGQTKFNIKNFKSNGASFFNSVKDIEHEDSTEEIGTHTMPNYFSSSTFDKLLNEDSESEAEENVATNSYNYNETDTTENADSPAYTNNYDNYSNEKNDDSNHYNFSDTNGYSNAEDYYSSTTTNESDNSSNLNFGTDESESNINDLSYWNKGFTLKSDDNKNFNYELEKDPEYSDSTDLIVKENYDSPSIKEDMPVAETDRYYDYNDETNNLDDTYYNPYGKDENATASLFTDNKRKFTPQFTDNESKTLLNTLSSYGSTNFEQATPSEKLQESTSSYDTLEDNLGKKGIIVTEYVRRPKEPKIAKNYIWCNKIKCVTSWIAYAITLALLITGFLIAQSFNLVDFNYISSAVPAGFYFWIFAVVLTCIPAVFTTIFCLNKTKKVKAKFNFKIAIIFSLLFFIQALVIVYAVNIPFGLYSFAQKDYNHYMWLLPAICTCYIPLHTIIYEVLYKSKKFHA